MVVHGGVRDECMRAVLEKEHKIVLDKQLVVLKLFCPENTLESTMPPHHTDEHPFLTLLSKEEYAKHVDKINNPPASPKHNTRASPQPSPLKKKSVAGGPEEAKPEEKKPEEEGKPEEEEKPEEKKPEEEEKPEEAAAPEEDKGENEDESTCNMHVLIASFFFSFFNIVVVYCQWDVDAPWSMRIDCFTEKGGKQGTKEGPYTSMELIKKVLHTEHYHHKTTFLRHDAKSVKLSATGKVLLDCVVHVLMMLLIEILVFGIYVQKIVASRASTSHPGTRLTVAAGARERGH